MTSNRPYFVKALYEWILDNACTPFIVVNTLIDGVQVPEEYVKEDQIVLNIAPHSINDFSISNKHIMFKARFSGAPREIIVPMSAVLAIYARENGQGMAFTDELDQQEATQADVQDSKVLQEAPSLVDGSRVSGEGLEQNRVSEASKPAKKPTLTVIK
ncbi:MAG: ClpXP protease specificity-enhancing factor [Pseudomonadota bacterium]